MVLIFHRFFLHSFEILVKRMSSRQYLSDVLPFGVGLIFLYSCRNRFRFRQEFLNIVFCIAVFYTYMQILFLGIIGNVLVYSLYWVCFKICGYFVELGQTWHFQMELIRQKFFGEILSFFVYFCYLKNCTCFFGKPYNGCLCACCRIAISLVIFAREFNSLVKYSIIF